MNLVIRNNSGESVSIPVSSNDTFMDVKERLGEEIGLYLDLQCIDNGGKRIIETQKVAEYFESGLPTNLYCSVPGCNNTKVSNPDKTFFEFPEDKTRCHQWILYCQRFNPELWRKRLNLIPDLAICSDHFTPDQFVKNSSTFLKRTAVPSVKVIPVKSPVPSFRNFETTEPPELCDRPDFNEDFEGIEDYLTFRLCRLCASACDDFVLIYNDLGRQLKIAEKIDLCLPIKVQVTDSFPKQICKPCLAQLEEIFEMADMCSLSQNKLINMSDEDFSQEDFTLVSLDDTDEETVVEPSGFDMNIEHKFAMKGFCPLCKEGQMTIKPFTNTAEPQEEELTSFSCRALSGIEKGSLDLGAGGLNDNCIGENNVVSVRNFSDRIHNTKSIEPFISINKGSYGIDSKLNGFTQQDYTTESDPLKLDDCHSKRDNDQISECDSSLTVLSSGDSGIKNMGDSGTLSPINGELKIEPDSFYLDTETENSSLQSLNDSICHTKLINKPVLYCRLCANQFSSYEDLLKHCFSHSFNGFYQCGACVTFFTNKLELEDHFNHHICRAKDSEYKCPVCSEYFTSVFKLKYHMQFHDNIPQAYFNVCDKSFCDEITNNVITLQKHFMSNHNTGKTSFCEECGRVFKSEDSMIYHQRVHQRDNLYSCEYCGKTFLKKSMLTDHKISHEYGTFKTNCFTCKICYEAFPNTEAAVSHMEEYHTKLECLDESTYEFEVHTISRLFVCEYCERCYAEGAVLNRHRDRHPTEQPYECKFCGSSVASLEEMKIHHGNHLKYGVPTQYLADFSFPKTYLCEYCERCFLNQVKYNEHLTIHFGREPYQCRHCTLKFATLPEAMEHRATHGKASLPSDDYNYYRPFECHYCNKTFAQEDALVKHIRMHTGEKPFICHVCGKGFSQSSGLYTHQKVHSTERPYSCDICNRTFKIKGDRDVHVRKHSGDRPFRCEFCGKAFMTQHVYGQHKKIHTGERPYKCDVCGVSFRRSHVLTVHKRIHTGEKPNICDICGKSFRQKGDMLKHKRVLHGIPSSKQRFNVVNY